MKKVLKYGTGQEVPENAQYLSTVVQGLEVAQDNIRTVTTRLVWHYFLVEIEDDKNK